MKLIETLNTAKQALKDAGIETPFLDAELLLAYVLQKNREFVIGRPEYELSTKEVADFEWFIKRRANFEPVAKIIGIKEFWGREFIVSGATLDPRPDSEALIEKVFEILPNKEVEFKVLDLGTGSGCLLLTILAEYPNSLGVGVDIASDTLHVARSNAEKLGLAKRSDFILNDWLEGMDGKFDLIISNPPYIKNSDIEKLAPEVSVHEPRLALLGGDDGLDCYRQIASQIKNLLNEKAYIVFEFGKGQEEDVRKILEREGMKFISFKNDLTGTPRCIVVSTSTSF